MPTALITGANRGIGAALATAAEAQGMTVIRATRAGQGGDICFDLRAPEDVRRSIAALDQPIDLLINNAGIIGPKRQSTTDMDFNGMAETFAVNVAGPLSVSNACLPLLRQSSNPRILTMSSQMAWMGYAKSDRIAYRASKTAVNKVMQGLATDLYAQGITVGLIDPGWVRTEMGGDDAEYSPQEVAQGVIDVAQTISLEQTGKFFKWTGEERAF
ncbi:MULTISPECIES: SDR family NAD(P)-dependent oxidoreductase [Pacificibacter]|uniref:SDR family NAD(P)-dependent oxidoreductase n=1 Tax=Pacificibacter TaxID=1042323 RepID=UPI001C0969B1|nr:MULTISPECIES: SDR family NAD(P)-dependent oxidoreductase [Pacificibacter]MBU2935663.1 SDR family NAD(P)-dependent oxidoreductase [Pacificibacter marinus]MDO6614159.1 SDR family NAD(P)-dependent oxidoreductase [Pacificibacter sp. 1_MG-2023]